MIVIDVLKILLLFLLCGYSSITDVKHGVISNRIILISSSMGLIFDIIGWILFDFKDFKFQVINILIVAFISIVLYALHIWAGGDCKLMLAISLIIPYELYIPLPYKWGSLTFLFAIIFGVSYIYLITDSIICAIKKRHIISKEKFSAKFKIILGGWICSVSYIILFDQIIMNTFPSITVNRMFIIIINISLVFLISGINFLRNKFIVIGVVISGIVLKIVFNQPIINKFMIINYSLAILFIMLRIFIDEYNHEIIRTSKVKKGMILSSISTLRFVNSKVKGLPSQSTEDLRSRLTENEAESVRRWEKSKYGTPTIEIVRKMPFAIFISAGTAIFMVLGAITQ